MLSVLIETMNDGEGLARTLSSLVGAAVEGVVREVVVCDRGSTDATAAVADHAGCTFIANADIAAGIRRAKGDWLLLLEPGARLEGDWMAAVLDHAATAAMPACFSRSRAHRAPFLSRFVGRPGPLADGLIISKRQAAALARPGGDASALARGLAMRRLRAEISPAPRKA